MLSLEIKERAKHLLRTTSISMTHIAKRLNCSQKTIVMINNESKIRDYEVHRAGRSRWVTDGVTHYLEM